MLCTGNEADTHAPFFAWVLNNYWETNFKATVGGFHEFRFRLSSGPKFADPNQGFEQLSRLSLGLPTITLTNPAPCADR